MRTIGSARARSAAALLLGFAAAAACASQPSFADDPPISLLDVRRPQKGVSYACWDPGLYSRPESAESLERLASTRAEWIALIVTVYQDDPSSTAIAPNEHTPTDADLARAIRDAHALGLKVMLKPHVDLARDPGHWRGDIGTAFADEASWTAWFDSYRAAVNHYADLAASSGAEQFCAGCELQGTSHREADWRRTVAAVRARFSGPVLYAANHDGEEFRLTWWNAVDAIGVDAYYPLARGNAPTVDELTKAWEPIVARLEALSWRWSRPVVLTEIGYRSVDGACRQPWEWQTRGRVDTREQVDGYQAALSTFLGRPWFAGIYWWSWSPDPREGGPKDDGFTPRGKPAESVLRFWFSAPRERRPGREVPRRTL